jgi:hypothetical protein
VQEALVRQAREWESEKTELTTKMEAKSERFVASNGKEAAGSRQATLRKELNRRAAETVSKQQMEGTKKVGCRGKRVEKEQIWVRWIRIHGRWEQVRDKERGCWTIIASHSSVNHNF